MCAPEASVMAQDSRMTGLQPQGKVSYSRIFVVIYPFIRSAIYPSIYYPYMHLPTHPFIHSSVYTLVQAISLLGMSKESRAEVLETFDTELLALSRLNSTNVVKVRLCVKPSAFWHRFSRHDQCPIRCNVFMSD